MGAGRYGDVAGDDREKAGDRRGDRRDRATRRISRYSFIGGRRQKVRRLEEREGSFVDVYGVRLLILVLWLALMNVGDSFFTLLHLQAGAIELNPVAEALLRTGRQGFVLYKSVLISFALLVLCVHKNFVLARLGLLMASAAYSALVCYHVFLLTI